MHSFGSLPNFHPHLHVMATDGGFTPDGVSHPLPTMSLAPIEGLFRHRVFGMLPRKGLLTPERIKLMKSWEHSAFNANARVRIGADDAAGRENLARCLIRAPFSMNKIRCDSAAGSVICKTSWARFIKKVFAADPLVCPDCAGAMRMVAFIEDQGVVRAILEHLLLWDEPRPPPVMPGAVPRAPQELQYLPRVE